MCADITWQAVCLKSFRGMGVSGRLLQTTPAVVCSLEPSGPCDCFEGRGTVHQMEAASFMNGRVLKGLLEEEVSANCSSVSVLFRDESEIRAGVA